LFTAVKWGFQGENIMDREIKRRFDNRIKQRFLQQYGVDPESCRPLDGFESFIFECDTGTGSNRRSIILRIGHSGRRNANLVRGEIDFINYLCDHGIPAARALPSPSGSLLETHADGHGEVFIGVAFRKIIGTEPWNAGWDDARYEQYGRLLGRMHALTKNYRVPDPAWKRPEWDDSVMHEVEENLDADNRFAVDRYRACCEQASGFSRDVDAYGLVHFDAHSGNMLVDASGRIHLFDFDDAHYTWFANDIAIVLFYMLGGQKDPVAFTDHFMTCFLEGYTRENRLDPRWLETIPMFLKMRQIDLYALLHRSNDVDNLDPTDGNDTWCLDFLNRNRPRIMNDVPVVDYDFRRLAAVMRAGS